MKLNDLKTDLLTISKELETKYKTLVKPKLSINENDLTEIILSFNVKTSAELTDETPVNNEVDSGTQG
jgi:hypothetical protein